VNPPTDPVLTAAGAAGVLVGILIPVTVLVTVLRRIDRRQLLVAIVSVLAVAIGVVAFHASLLKLTAMAGGAWGPGLALEGGLFVATIVELSKNARGLTAPAMRKLSWILLFVTMAVNASGEDTAAKILLHGVVPLVWKVGGLKTLLMDLTDVQLEDHLPAIRWAQAPLSTFWCWRQKVLGRVTTYAAALAIDTDVAVRDIQLREDRAANGDLSRWQRRPSARDLALKDALTRPGSKRRTPTKDTAPVPQDAPRDTPAGTPVSRGDTPDVSPASCGDIAEDARRVRDDRPTGQRLSVRYMKTSLQDMGWTLGNDRASALIKQIETEDTPRLHAVEGTR
jgi:hypothetical protein